jgi:hypothetical protein
MSAAHSAPFLESVRCHYCSKTRPRFRVHVLASNQAICDYCLDWHHHAIEFLGGETTPRGCSGCGMTYQAMCELDTNSRIRLWVVMKDGIYQLLCKTCVAGYLPKRADLYKGTAFGCEALNL